MRTMGDATHDCVPQLAALNGLELVAGYDTGSFDIAWTADDFARFPGIPHLTIDQGFTGSPNLKANIRDVEFNAWAPGQAVNRAGWNVPRPTIYCTLSETGYGLLTTPGVLADGWRGDLWLSIPGWQPGDALPATPGCTVVAVQNDFTNPSYDLSVVLDPYWPASGPAKENDMIIWLPAPEAGAYLLSGGRLHHIADAESLALYEAAGVPVVGSPTGPRISAAEEAALLADYPAGNPAVTVPPVTVTVPELTLSGTITHT